MLSVFVRGRKLSLIKYFFQCTICIWLCNNNENWKQFFMHAKELEIFRYCDSITFSLSRSIRELLAMKIKFCHLRANKIKLGVGGCVPSSNICFSIWHDIYATLYRRHRNVKQWTIWNFDINIWLQLLEPLKFQKLKWNRLMYKRDASFTVNQFLQVLLVKIEILFVSLCTVSIYKNDLRRNEQSKTIANYILSLHNVTMKFVLFFVLDFSSLLSNSQFWINRERKKIGKFIQAH